MEPESKRDPRPASRVPEAELQEQFERFRRTYSSKVLEVDGVAWSYCVGGSGSDALMMLPGATGVAELAFQQALAFQDEFRVLLPGFARVGSLAALLRGLVAVLDAEGVARCHLIGGSYGGLVAQLLTRAHPQRVTSLILSHTGIPDRRRVRAIRLALKLIAWLPGRWLRSLLVSKATSLIPPRHPARPFFLRLFKESFAQLEREDFLARYRGVLELDQNHRFGPGDLAGWEGKVLILESDADPLVKPAERQALRAAYPGAQVHVFHGTGHATALLEPDAYAAVVRSFLGEPRASYDGHEVS